ncbi:MAG: hypothetical protein GF350_08620 [Chitinivibrionales bacterium]|nr:hypothetical protein [Chitinivibrionales bacterium]
MKATKNWGLCFCNCGQSIKPGDEFVIVDGGMYLAGHEVKATRNMPAIKSGSSTKKSSKKSSSKKYLSDLPLFSPDNRD